METSRRPTLRTNPPSSDRTADCGSVPDAEAAQTEEDGQQEIVPPNSTECDSAGWDSTSCSSNEPCHPQGPTEPESAGRPVRPSGSADYDSADPSRQPESAEPESTGCNSLPRDPSDSDCVDSAERDSAEYDSDEPRRPLDSECCGSGCSPCVFDLYDRDLVAWRRRCEQRRSAGSANPPASAAAAVSGSPLRPDCFTALPLASITALSDTSSLYRFLLPAGASLRLPPGAHLRLRASDSAGHFITRAYTPVSPPQTEGYFDVYVRRYPSGAMSSCMRRWQPGQLTLWSGPFGGYRHRRGDARQVLLAAGTGVAPFVGLVRFAVEDEDSETRLTLLLSVRRLQDVFPRKELTQWARYWNFTYRLFVSGSQETGGSGGRAREGSGGTTREGSEETAGDGSGAGEEAWYGEPVRWRRLQKQDVQEVVRQPAGRTRYLVCGTLSFEKDVLNYLREAGVADEDVFRF